MRYTVRPGDTLGQIAQRFSVPVQALTRANEIWNPHLIHPGDTLHVPGQTDHFERSRDPQALTRASPGRGKAAAAVKPKPAVEVSGQQAVALARRYMGTPYNYSHDRSKGGFSRTGNIDCSQLVSKVYPRFPPDVAIQGRMGKLVGSPVNAKPGDLVFFDENGSGRATHVGIATGRGTVIHASSFHGKVCETPIRYISSHRTWAVRP
jgi:cell wall-associated NlpC family hydrolase